MYSHKHHEQSFKINSERLFLRPIIKNDSDLIVSWRNSSEVRSTSFDNNKLTIENHFKWFNNNRCNRVDYVFDENTGGKAIGFNFVEQNKNVKIKMDDFMEMEIFPKDLTI